MAVVANQAPPTPTVILSLSKNLVLSVPKDEILRLRPPPPLRMTGGSA
jgi:hypothetical protein